MKQKIKDLIRNFLKTFFAFLLNSKIGMRLNEILINNAMNHVIQIQHNEIDLKFTVPNNINRFRVKTFSNKEPETLEWIDSFEKNSIFWDIGANIGLYSCYAAKHRDCKVFSFEPSVFNLELLARNIYLNNLSEKIIMIPIALTEKLTLSKFNMTSTDLGGALSTFEHEYTHDGSNIKKTFNYSTLGISMDEVINLMKISHPDYIKIDVDGIEHLILKGGSETLRKTKSLLVEIDDKFEKQKSECKSYLEKSGFIFTGKYHSPIFNNTKLNTSYNQIWLKK